MISGRQGDVASERLWARVNSVSSMCLFLLQTQGRKQLHRVARLNTVCEEKTQLLLEWEQTGWETGNQRASQQRRRETNARIVDGKSENGRTRS